MIASPTMTKATLPKAALLHVTSPKSAQPKRPRPGRFLQLAISVSIIQVMSLSIGHAAEQAAWDNQNISPWTTTVAAEAIVIEGTTAIRWLPQPYQFEAGEAQRYIDFVDGDDTRDGLSPATAWQRHPWDPQATGVAATATGVLTCIFKGGVTYHGHLIGRESGRPDQPIRLTRDPAWGNGPAIIAGTEPVQDWQLATPEQEQAAHIPEASLGKVWTTTLAADIAPRAAWLRHADGRRERLVIARWPNWTIEHPYNHFTQWFRVEEADGDRGTRWPMTTISAEVLKGFAPDAFNGATIWTNHASSGGMISIIGPYPAAVKGYDPEHGSVRVALTHPHRFPQPQSPFFLENLPRFLDQDGEWTFVPSEHRIYARLPQDQQPSDLIVEVARHQVIIDLVDQHHIDISGLHITGGNAMDLNTAPRGSQSGDLYLRPGNFATMAAIRLSGDVQSVTLRHLVISDSAGSGIVNAITQPTNALAHITIADSEFFDLDNDGIHFDRTVGPVHHPYGRVDDITIVRNRMETIGLRCSVDQGGRGINLNGLRVGDIAGNVIHRTAAMGINVVGDKGPLNRIQIHHNQVSEGLLHKNDFGNIEFWGQGPAYVYNNISIDPVGFFANYSSYHKGEAFYFDHGVKAFLFNNIAWSKAWPEARHGVLGQTFFKEVRNRWNQAFHNTAYSFRLMQNMEGVNGQQEHYLANLFIQSHVSTSFLSHWGLEDADEIGYARNVLAGPHRAVFGRERGAAIRTAAEFQKTVAELGNHVTTDVPAWVTADMPVIDPDARDFRLTDDSAAIDRGVRVFVPWGLYGTVGEWFFRCQPRKPDTVMAYDIYGQDMYTGSAVPDNIPSNDLIGDGITVADYVPGILEDWNNGALVFDGTRTLRLAQERLIKDITKARRKQDPEIIPGRERDTVRMQNNNFLIEVVLRAEPNAAVIAGKIDTHAGYALELDEQGRPALRLLGQDGSAVIHVGPTVIADGRWHHLLSEVDRITGQVTMFVDGVAQKIDVVGSMPASEVSLDNEADFVIGAGLHGALDYLRVCRGTLADARTDIATLMSWQFAGPHLHDFVGKAATGSSRDVGAIEHPSVSGRQPIREPEPSSMTTVTDSSALFITQPWKARLIAGLESAAKPQHGHVDPGVSPEALAAVQPAIDDTDWDNYTPIPNRMWDGFADSDGEAVFRVHVDVPAAWAGRALALSLGAVDDFDATYWNGTFIGTTTSETPAFWEHPRNYIVPAEHVVAGPAVIAVRVFDRFGGGGFNSIQGEIALRPVDAAEEVTTDEDGWLGGPGRRIQAMPWGAISVPRQASAGASVTLQVSFGVETFQTTPAPILLALTLHTAAPTNGATIDGAPGLIAIPTQTVTPMDPRPYAFTLTLPDLGPAGKVTAQFYASPDGSWDHRYLAGTTTIDIEP